MVDQLASQVLMNYGADVIDTPHINALAAKGVTYDNMISTSCRPLPHIKSGSTINDG